MMPSVLFVCVHNAGRSQMAQAFLELLSVGQVQAFSAGTDPGQMVDPTVMKAMAEVGIDLSGHHPRLLTQEMVEQADRVISMGCGVEESCPAFLTPTEDWDLEDPKGQPLEAVREIRDEIRSRVEQLLGQLQPVTQRGP